MPPIVIHASGTLGDHLPFIALGRALAGRGHRVTLAINQAVHGFARAAGLEAVALTDVERGEEQACELAEICRGADLLLAASTSFLPLVAHRGSVVPWITLSVNPSSFVRPEGAREREALQAQSLREYRIVRERLAMAWKKLGIETPLPGWSPTWHYARHVILASSAHFSRPDLEQLQPWHSVEQTGFLFYEDPAWPDWRPDPELEEFCRRRPIVLAFGSQPLEDPARVLRLHVEAAALVGLPLLVQRGWAGFSEDDLPPGTDSSSVHFTGFLPQDWLFARASCSIRHAGVGSIARALRQGCPLLVEPFGNDQLYNAERVRRLGVGAAVHPFKTTAADLARLLSEEVLTEERRRRVEQVGAQIRGEDGLGRVCDLVERFLRCPERDDRRPRWRVPGLAETRTPAVTSGAAIPRIIHQIWMQGEPPEDLAARRVSWREHHPDWEHRLWDERAIRELVSDRYAWLLPVWDGYPELIMRADIGRYVILHRYGGVYLDMDLECLRPLGPLLAGESLVAALEPQLHRLSRFPGGGAPRHLLANGFIASTPGHPFWDHLFKELVRRHHLPDPFSATGPMLLTGACESWPARDEISLVPAECFFPFATAVHFRRGDWWRPFAGRDPAQLPVTLLERGRAVLSGRVAAEWLPARLAAAGPLPLISCLMVTKDRPALARQAVACYRRQTYPNRELVVVDDGVDGALQRWCRGLGDATIRFVRLPPEGRTLGDLRNVAVGNAAGEFVAQWDDDDLSDPRRLETQMAALLALDAGACMLERQQLWWPASRRMAISCRRLWEGSSLALRSSLGRYPEERQGEDTPVVERFVAAGRVVLLDAPWLYTYVHHGTNVWPAPHWEAHWESATERFEGLIYGARLRALAKRHGLRLTAEGALELPAGEG